jgi:heme/copper-type cytochrome/quinol oxidase subunit 4
MEGLITGIIGAVIALVIALALVPTVITSSNEAGENATGATKTLLALVPLVFVAGLVVLVIFLFMKKGGRK